MNRRDPQDSPQLEQLEGYEVIGELSGERADARLFLARRAADGLDVLVSVSRPPQDDEGNALSHLAADANLLRGNHHRNLLTVLDGKWFGTDAFATILERPRDPNLSDVLSRRSEEFSYPRIAAILRDVNAVLEWAREAKVVHRLITPDTLFVEPGSDRVCVSFAVTALARSGMPGPESDARVVAALARAMLTRSPADPERDERPLGELRPGLPQSLVDETEALLRGSTEGAPDVTLYIARIAMAEALKHGEDHLAETRRVIEEQQRAHKEQIEKERHEHEQQLAAERREHERQVAEQAKKFQKEREVFQRELARDQKQLAKEREALSRERASHARDRAVLLQERAAHERNTAEERERLKAEAAASLALAEALKRKPVPERPKAEVEPSEALALVPMELAPHVVEPRPELANRTQSGYGRVMSRLRDRRTRSVAMIGAALLFLVGVSALALARRHSPPEATAVATPLIVDSAGGNVYESVVPLPVVTSDTVTIAESAKDWIPPKPRVQPRESGVDESSGFTVEQERPRRRERATRADSTDLRSQDSSVLNPDSLVPTSVPRPNRDSATRRDSTRRKRDSVRTDTLIRRDST